MLFWGVNEDEVFGMSIVYSRGDALRLENPQGCGQVTLCGVGIVLFRVCS